VDKFQKILLDVWREACRHIEISASCANIAGLLVNHMPIEQLLVRRIEPDRPGLDTLAVGLADAGGALHEARTACSPEAMHALLAWAREGAPAWYKKGAPAAPELDVIFPHHEGRGVLCGPLAVSGGPVGVLVLVACADTAFEARHVEMVRVLLEPFAVALENDRRLREADALREAAEADKRSLLTKLGRTDFGDVIVGADAGLRSVMERVELVARSDVPVLILGETGTGKELVARAIHNSSARASGPVMRVNCGAIPPGLVDSQLFGHERGAFTGAVQAHKGWLERADGGTLFLDEIGELPVAAQVRLLHILQDGWLERVGARHPVNVDVRLVAATHRDLAAMVSEGTFREDLWYRINVFPILLPPLRDRTNDIPLLARHFAEKAALRFGLPALMPSNEDIALLASYAWPGNVRELGAVMDRAALLGNGVRLEIAKALGVPGAAAATPQEAPAEGAGSSTPTRAIVPLDEAMRRHIEAALVYTKGRVQGPHGAARLLDINPHTLRARMRKLGIRRAQFQES